MAEGKGDDAALARTVASDDPGLARTVASGAARVAVDPALAATMLPDEVAAPRQRENATLTAEHPGRYVRDAEIGRGGMGRVVLVKDMHLGREVALKELLVQGGTNDDAMSVGSAARFLREARVTGQLEHPGIVPVHELGQRPDGTIYYTMKRIRGRSLASLLAEKKTLAERLTLLSAFRFVCDAVAYAHSRGVVHRDLKPDNVMIGEFGDTLVVDWGLAKVRGEAELPSVARSSISGTMAPVTSGDIARTIDGHAIGTPAYMSPEQARGELGSIDERADVWGLGAILFEILAGRPPYQGTSALDVLAKVLDDPPPRIREVAPDAPKELAAIVDRALMRDSSSRYPSAGAVAKEIGAYLDGRTVGAYEYSALELVMRFVRRHRAASIAVSSIALCLIVASIVVYRSFLQEAHARAIAETARDEAMVERGHAMDSMHDAENAVAEALLDRAERALDAGDPSGAAIFSAGVLVRGEGVAAEHRDAAAEHRAVRALSLYLEADARRRYVFERTVPGAHARSALSTDGLRVAIPTESALRVVSLDSGAERRVELHATRVRALGAGDLAVIASEHPGVYDLTTGTLVHETPMPTGASMGASGIAIAAQDGQIVMLSADGRTQLDAWASGHTGQVRAVLSPAGDRVAVLASDAPQLTLVPWPRVGAPEVVHLEALPYNAAFSPHGETLAVLVSDTALALIAFSPTRVTTLPTESWPTALAWDATGALALLEDGDRVTVRASDGHALDVVHLPPSNGGRIETGGERLVYFPYEGPGAVRDAVVMHRTVSSGRDAVTLPNAVRDLVLDAPRHRVVVATLSAVHSVSLGLGQRLGTLTEIATLPSEVGVAWRIAVASDGAIAIVTMRGGLVLCETDAAPVVLRAPPADLPTSPPLLDVVFSTDGREIFSGSPGDGRILRWSRDDHREGTALEGHTRTVGALEVSPDGALLASGAADGSLRLWNLRTGQLARTLEGGDALVAALAFSPSGDRLASGDEAGHLRVFAVADGHRVLEGTPHDRWINGMHWSADARSLVTTSDDRSVRIVSTTTLASTRIVRTLAAPITAVLASDGSHVIFHDGRTLVSLDLRLAMAEPDAHALLTQAEEHAGMRLDGLSLVAQTP